MLLKQNLYMHLYKLKDSPHGMTLEMVKEIKYFKWHSTCSL